ncbi:MAG: hypothetical protein D4R65_10190 [Verrucomicrobiaceae bacterium]|nr:MAG: hypothetical protein D4R65_10190 [Verrucomicrobiaceae bacterium]
MKRLSFVILVVLASAVVTSAARADGAPFDLTTEMHVTPLGIDLDQLRVSWKMPVRQDAPGKVARGQRQTAYQILVAPSLQALQSGQLLWDSGKVESSNSQLVPFGVKPESFRRYFWTVRTWDQKQLPGGYAPATWFETGAIHPSDWQLGAPCKWIQSPLVPIEDEKFRTWAKFAIFPLHLQLDKSSKLTTEDIAKSEREYYDLFRDTACPASLFRREFTVKSPPVRARLYISGLGYYRAFLNGQKLGERDLEPSDSHFSVKVNYQVFDLTSQLKSGNNCLGVQAVTGRLRAWLGHTPEQYHDRPVLIARLALEYADGTQEIISTDASWQCGSGGIERQKFWCGELFDANTEPVGWKLPGFDAHGWVAAEEAKLKHPLGELRWDIMPPEKIVEQGHPIKRTNPMPGVWVYDFGKQLGGRVRLHFKGLQKGQMVVVRYSEALAGQAEGVPHSLAFYDGFENTGLKPGMLKFKRRGSDGAFRSVDVTLPDGKKKRMQFGGIAYTDMFVSSGKPEEVWEPSFTYTGFRYIEVLGLKTPLELSEVDGFDLHTVPPRVGTLTTDTARLNRVLQAVQDTLELCYHSQFQDNNGAERYSHSTLPAMNNLNTAYWLGNYDLLSKLQDDNIRMNESLHWPATKVCGARATYANSKNREIEICGCYHYSQTPRDLAAFYGDQRLLEPFIPWMIQVIREMAEYSVWNQVSPYGDHIADSALADLPELQGENKTLSRMFAQCEMVMQIGHEMVDLLQVLGRKPQALEVQEILNEFQQECRNRFFDAKTGVWFPTLPTRQQLDVALDAGNFEPRASRETMAKEIVEEFRTKTKGHLITGSPFSYPLLHLLSQGGQADAACDILLREDYPSILNMVSQTGNSIRESWGESDSFAQIEGITAMGNWFYRDLVGIEPDLHQPAFGHFTLRPTLPRQVNSVDFSYESPRGLIKSRMLRQGGQLKWDVTVPPNATATVSFPCSAIDQITESGKPVKTASGVAAAQSVDSRPSVELASGTYHFISPCDVAAPSPSAAPEEGDLIGARNTVFVIRDGQLRHIPNMKVFNANGFKVENVIRIPDEGLDALPEGPDLTAVLEPYVTPREGDLIDATGTVFLIQNGLRCKIPDMEIFNAKGFKWKNVIRIPEEDLNAILEGSNVE